MTKLLIQSILFLFYATCSINQCTLVAAQDESEDLDAKLFEAAKDEDTEAAAEALKLGANINALSQRGKQTPLMQSVLHGREKMVKFFLENGADVTIPERDGYTPMHGVGFQGRASIGEMLVKHGVGLRDKHKDGYEPAIRSCWGREPRHTDTLQFFLDNGVPVEDIYDQCMEMTENAGTKALLQKRNPKSEEL